jgi:hypothetical protein
LSHADEYMPDFMELSARGIKSSMVMWSAGRNGSVRDPELMERIRPIGNVAPAAESPDFPKGGWGALPSRPCICRERRYHDNKSQRTINMAHPSDSEWLPLQDDDHLATMVANKINDMMDEDNSVFKVTPGCPFMYGRRRSCKDSQSSQTGISAYLTQNPVGTNYLTFAGKNSKDFLLYISAPGVYDSPRPMWIDKRSRKNGDIIRENAKSARAV